MKGTRAQDFAATCLTVSLYLGLLRIGFISTSVHHFVDILSESSIDQGPRFDEHLIL